MWFMKYIANPLVKLILSSPLHPLLSASTLLITVSGRKTGKAYTLPVNYACDGDEIWIIPGQPERKTWWRNLGHEALVTVTYFGRRRCAEATLFQGSPVESAAVNGLQVYFTRFPASAKTHSLQLAPNGRFDPAALQAAASSIPVVRIRLT